MNKIPLYHGAAGLNDKVDQMRVSYAEDSGILGLTQADDITIDQTGAMSRRQGFTLLASGICHSVFSCREYGLYVLDGNLCLSDKGALSVLSAVGNYKVAYARHFDGSDDLIYYSNGLSNGIIRNKVNESWTVPAYVGIDSSEARVKRFETSVPGGHILGIFNGRMYIAQNNRLYPSESFAFSWFDITKAYLFGSRITMVRPVTSGIYVSTMTEVFFLLGNDLEDFSRRRVLNYGAVEGTDVLITAIDASIQAQDDAFFFAASGGGICSADGGGIITNHTDSFLAFPRANVGAAYINDKKQYVVTLLQ